MRNNICILVYMFTNLFFELLYYLKELNHFTTKNVKAEGAYYPKVYTIQTWGSVLNPSFKERERLVVCLESWHWGGREVHPESAWPSSQAYLSSSRPTRESISQTDEWNQKNSRVYLLAPSSCTDRHTERKPHSTRAFESETNHTKDKMRMDISGEKRDNVPKQKVKHVKAKIHFSKSTRGWIKTKSYHMKITKCNVLIWLNSLDSLACFLTFLAAPNFLSIISATAVLRSRPLLFRLLFAFSSHMIFLFQV